VRSLRNRWSTGASAEVSRRPGGQLGRGGQDGLGLWSLLRRKARKPQRYVDVGVSDHRSIPVDDHRAPIAKAEVVAPYVEVQQSGTT
jgi:hypothetical protein